MGGGGEGERTHEGVVREVREQSNWQVLAARDPKVNLGIESNLKDLRASGVLQESSESSEPGLDVGEIRGIAEY